MSRTYRSITPGDYWFPHEWRDLSISTRPYSGWGIEHKSREEINLPKINGVKLAHYNKRDRKPYYKPNKCFKKTKQREFRARCKDALRRGRPFPPYSRDNEWDWN